MVAHLEPARGERLAQHRLMRTRLALAAVSVLLLQACAQLNQLGALVQPPRFEQVPDRPAEIRLQGMTGAGVRLWTRVTNPNPFGLRLGTLKGTLYLEDSRAADADFPLGLSLGAGGDSVDSDRHFDQLRGSPGLERRRRGGSSRASRFPTGSTAPSVSTPGDSDNLCSVR